LESFLSGLESSAVALAFRGSAWLYPAVEFLHIVGFVVLVGAAFVLDLRLLGRFRALPLRGTVQSLSRWARWGLLLAVLSGVALFVADASALAANPAFRLKLALLVAAGLNAAVFHRVVFRRLDGTREGSWREPARLPLAARAAGVVSIVLWLSLLASGRMIAYL
jgi:hypothetical protein